MTAASHHRLSGVLGRLRQAADAPGSGSPTDAELLGRYVATRDAAAFELLVWRHGAMVLNACRRLLARPDDADDAFQATFLTLVRRAAAISKHEALAGWLHTVACRVALRARATAAKRSRREQSGVDLDGASLAGGAQADPAVSAELRAALDAEIMRLPRKFRDPFVLCYLEGLSNEEAAGRLGCPKGTVMSRLARARARLRGRLTRRGLGLPGTLLGAASFEALASAPAPLVATTVRAASLLAAGGALTSAASPPVAALTQGVLHAMFISKVKAVASVVVGLALVAAGSGQVFRTSARAQGSTDQAAVGQAAVGQRDPASKADRKQDPNRAAQADIDTARVHLHEAQIKLSQAESDLAAAEAAAKIAQVEADKARNAVEALSQAYQRLAPDAAAVTPKKPPATRAPAAGSPARPTKSPPKRESRPAAENTGLRLPGGTQSDLIQLATTYVDAVRDLQTAELRVRHAQAGVTPIAEREIREVELRAAQRKVELLRAIVTGAMHSAERELEDHARRMQLYERGYAARPDTSAAENKVRVLKMILGTAN